ncbi:hypothetical protein Efla_005455 [Eimeria flavescens]
MLKSFSSQSPTENRWESTADLWRPPQSPCRRPSHEMASIRLACCAGAVFFLIAATACWAAAPFDSTGSEGGFPDKGGAGKLGKLKVKAKSARLLSAGNTVSATRGDLSISGFDAHMRLNNITLGSARAAGLKASRTVRMPFTQGLADISNRAALAAVQRPGAPEEEERPSSAGDGGASMTPEERRQRILRILRAIMPHIQRRLVIIRMRQQRPDALQGGPSAAASEEGPQAQKIQELEESNAKLKRVNKLLLVVVRGLIRRSLELRRQLEAQKSQQAEGAGGETPQVTSEGSDANSEDGSAMGGTSSGEPQQQFLSRRLLLMRQYPPASDSNSPIN